VHENVHGLTFPLTIFGETTAMRASHYSAATVLTALIALVACKHEETEDPIDADLLELAMDDVDYTWYKESDALLPRSSGSGHAQALLRTRFNTIASSVLDTNGQVRPDTTFPNGSVIVKELFEDANTLSQYAILYKKPSHPYADADGWVWGYVRPDGEVREPSRNKGSACRGCHGQANNIDFTLMNAYFP
jgi:hypothetical protein